MLVDQTNMIIATVQRINDTTITEINNLTVSQHYVNIIADYAWLLFHLVCT